MPVTFGSAMDASVGCNVGSQEWQWARGVVKQAEVALAQHEASQAAS